MVVQRVEKIGDLLFLRAGQLDEILGEITHLGGDDFPAGLRKEFGDDVQVLEFSDETGAQTALGNLFGFQRLDVLRAGFNGIGFGIARFVGMRGFDNALVIEEKTDAAGRTQRASAENVADFRRRPRC